MRSLASSAQSASSKASDWSRLSKMRSTTFHSLCRGQLGGLALRAWAEVVIKGFFLTKLVKKSLHSVQQRRQCGLVDVPHRAVTFTVA